MSTPTSTDILTHKLTNKLDPYQQHEQGEFHQSYSNIEHIPRRADCYFWGLRQRKSEFKMKNM